MAFFYIAEELPFKSCLALSNAAVTFFCKAVTFSREAVTFFCKAVTFSREAVTFYLSLLTSHLSPLTSHLSPLTSHLSLLPMDSLTGKHLTHVAHVAPNCGWGRSREKSPEEMGKAALLVWGQET